MRLTIRAVGRLRAGPERALIDDYLARAGRAGRPLGLAPIDEVEVEDRKAGGPAAEALLLTRKLSPDVSRVALDERGRLLSSPALAEWIAGCRDAGRAEAVFFIGGADGLDPGLRKGADLILSFGQMVWPHALARVMLAEQLYRVTQILAGTPYHRA
ncbi:23S rRNA (pseudouridine(1915)-N(3))-methyltransferase RlmH [Rhodosalinus sp.]|uniref:23S rRNA (pseudouridine(1915)-N(3))-methyltransferase RlmH n=1 Tax=Rhodosalinus sp. TaxID=2047741 RepID=UPI00397B7B38